MLRWRWGRFWTETVAEESLSNMRVEEAVGTGAEMLVAWCPFCALDSDDNAKAV